MERVLIVVGLCGLRGPTLGELCVATVTNSTSSSSPSESESESSYRFNSLSSAHALLKCSSVSGVVGLCAKRQFSRWHRPEASQSAQNSCAAGVSELE